MTARKAPLRAVKSTERAPRKPRRPTTVKAAAASGSRRDLLVTMRDRIATDVDNPNTSSRDLAALTRRLLEIANDIAVIDARAKGDPISRAVDTPDEAFGT